MRNFSHLILRPGFAIWALLSFAGCGETQNPDPVSPSTSGPLEGDLHFQRFDIPEAGERFVTGNVKIFAEDVISIRGTMRVRPGVTVTLVAEDSIWIGGTIKPDTGMAVSRSARSADEATISAATSSFIVAANGIGIDGRIALPPDTDFLAAGIFKFSLANPRIAIGGTIETSALDAASTRAGGGRSGAIEIGTARAVRAVADQVQGTPTAGARTFFSVHVSDTLRTGDGGRGGDDRVGTLIVGDTRAFTASDGGAAGDIVLSATGEIDVSLARLLPGNGGAGGDAGDSLAARGVDGVAPGASGQNMRAESGHGGDGGSIELEAAMVVPFPPQAPGRGGAGGSVFLSAGNGGPGGDGGDASIFLGAPGAAGTGRTNAPAIPPVTRVLLLGGANGGDSDRPQFFGGDGGYVQIKSRGNRRTLLHRLRIDGYGNAGAGYSGCASEPQVGGTGGGDAATVPAQDQFVSVFADTSVTVFGNTNITGSFRGGDGGDGITPGARGTGGFSFMNRTFLQRIGDDGITGESCADPAAR
ncbi:MAG: hypothetical protein ACKVU1_04535 [bacterium]